MEKRKLTPEQRGMKNDQFEQLKDLLIRWLRPVPSEKFFGCDEAPCFSEDDPVWNYKPRYLKTCFLRGIKKLGHISQIPDYLSYLSHSATEEMTVLFLCSKLAMTNAELVQPLIDYIDDDDIAQIIADNYEDLIHCGLKNLCYFDRETHMTVCGNELFQKVLPQNRLSELDCNYMLLRLTDITIFPK